MPTDILAISLLVASQLIISFVFFIIGRKQLIFALATLSQVIDEKIQVTIDEVSGVFGEIFEKPNVKKAFSIIGSQGGKATADNAMMDKIATDVLNGPKLAGIKTVAKMGLGIDIDSYIEEDGAIKTLQNLQGLGELIGVDITSVLGGALGGQPGMNLSVGHEANSNNPYRR